ncbi:alpha/beta fold hydrolase [Ilumatobacter coccineus]|uniref:AB hydrolase-1 domain-containing protein n=1 Tax=Ilumatobacter coccineus (strain NBRC 103263 / KCTC 29153 / YM16-304) TaxID=1313172 RepID=A0A6C7EB59_ILUCY|nr:alpha/beta hydrolase [Ilumatobacter coccineus]BAN01868.1 hypothetical protein YM304_15540 [Ilumatobacter coccineus YM16-304]
MPATPLTPADLDRIPAPTGPPNRAGLIGEVSTVLQPGRLLLKSPRLRSAPRGDGRIALFLPGWKAPDVSTLPIRGYLGRLGHDARSWGLGVNQGDVEAKRDEMIGIVERLAESSGRPVNLVGWSLGGVVSREIARNTPDAVHRVVTYGTPVVGGPTHTAGASTYAESELARIRALQEHLDATDPIATPITAIFTRNDSAVDWRACIDRSSTAVTMIEVGSTHVGLGIDPDVWLVVANALAE